MTDPGTGPVCDASESLCGTLSGYQSGGRCYRCCRANNAKRAAERGNVFSRDQRDAVISMVNGGTSFDAAVRQAGTSTQKVMHAARSDSELRCALEGKPLSVQYAARLGDYLAALCRNGGATAAAYAESEINSQQAGSIRAEDPAFAKVEASLIEYLGGANHRLTFNRIPDLVIDHAAALIAGGQTIKDTCRELGISQNALTYRRGRHPALDEAMTAASTRHQKHQIPSAVIDRAVDRIEQGATLKEAAAAGGFSPSLFYRKRAQYPRLDAAMTLARRRWGRD